LAEALVACDWSLARKVKLMATYTITKNSGMMPNQIEGITADGKWFYFRGRHHFAKLYVANSEEEWQSDINHQPIWQKEVTDAGWFEPDEFESLFWQVIAELEA